MALPGRDGVEGHPRGLHAGGAEPVDRGRGDVVQTELDGDPPGHVAAVLVPRLGAAEVDVVQGVRVEPRESAQRRLDHPGGQVVGPDAGQRALDRPTDRRPAGGDDDGLVIGSRLEGSSPRSRPIISFMISLVPAQIRVTRASAQARATRYSFM